MNIIAPGESAEFAPGLTSSGRPSHGPAPTRVPVEESVEMTPGFTVIRDTTPAAAIPKGTVVAMGNFDGVHLGHRAVIAAALQMGRAHGKPALAVTFEPHPRSFFSPNTPQFRLTDEAGKLRLLAGTGLAGAVVMTFDKARAGTTAQDFIHHDLIERLGISGIAVGYDFHFGKGRVGSPSLLVSEAPRLGIEVDVQPHVDIAERPVSSSAIRMALAEGQIEDATAMLGGPWFVAGEVIHGEKRGRDLGYPTANIRLDKNCGLKHGIYAVRVGRGDERFDGVASFGRRPTFDNGAPLLEVFLFDFKGDLYGEDAGRRLHRLHPRGIEIRQRGSAGAPDGRRQRPRPRGAGGGARAPFRSSG